MGDSFVLLPNMAITICAHRRVIGFRANSNSPKTLMKVSLFTQNQRLK
jgi:hypothetical protein